MPFSAVVLELAAIDVELSNFEEVLAPRSVLALTFDEFAEACCPVMLPETEGMRLESSDFPPAPSPAEDPPDPLPPPSLLEVLVPLTLAADALARELVASLLDSPVEREICVRESVSVLVIDLLTLPDRSRVSDSL